MIENKFGEKFYKLGLHLHTTLSDGRKSPIDVAEEYKADGYDAIALTDHWKYGESGELGGLHIISGCEYNLGINNTIDGVMHILSLFTVSEPIITRESTASEVVDAIEAAGGISVLAHPAWSLNTPEELKALPKIAATEIYNAVSDAGESLRPYSDYFVDICANMGIYPLIFATDDAHYYEGEDNRRGWIMVKADELSDTALKNSILKGDFYASEGPDMRISREGTKFIIDSTPCEIIGALSNLSWRKDRVIRQSGATHFEYEPAANEKWVRFELKDSNGRRAFSNIFVL